MDQVINYFVVRGLVEEATLMRDNIHHPVVIKTLDIIANYSEDKMWVCIPDVNTSYDRMLGHLVAEACGFYSMTKTIPDITRPRSPKCKICIIKQYENGTKYLYIGHGSSLVDTISKKNRGHKTVVYQSRLSSKNLPYKDRNILGPVYKSMNDYTITKKAH